VRFRPSSIFLRLGVGCLLLLLGFKVAMAGDSPVRLLYLVDIAGLGRAELDALKASNQVELWLEIGDALVVIGPSGLREALRESGAASRLADAAFDESRYRILASRDPVALEKGNALFQTIAHAGALRLVRLKQEDEQALALLESFRFQITEFPHESLVLHAQKRNRAGQRTIAGWDAGVQEVVDALDPVYLAARTQALTGISSRYSLSTNFVNATNHVVAQYAGLGLPTELDPFVVQGRTVNNVLSEIPGLLHPDDIYILAAHYDTHLEYPGADDNGSGTATTLAIAKVFAQHLPLSTIRFVNFAAEEEGLVGSNHYVSDLLARKDHDRIRGVINMDMVAYENRTDGKIDVLLEGRSRLSQRLMDDLAASAVDYTALEPAFISYNPFGSDHIPFLNKNIPTLLTIENEDGLNPNYHTAQDTYATLNGTLHREISKMNLAALAKMAGTRDVDDSVPPGAVVGPSITGVTHTAITVGWTSSGDDGSIGSASAYDVRYAPTPILDDAAFSGATPANGEPRPSLSGTAQSFSVMGLDPGTRYCLAVKAIDDNLNASSLPPGALCATSNPVDVRFSDDVESGTGGWSWTSGSPWHRDTFRNRTPGGMYAWRCGGTGSAYYTNNLNASLISQYVTLGPGSVLQFWHRMLASETSDTQSPDGGVVEIQPFGSSTWTQIAPIGGYNFIAASGPFPAGTPLFAGDIPWKEVDFDLASYAGDVRFRFRFGSNASGTWEGWTIDDVAVVSQIIPEEVEDGAGNEPPLMIGKAAGDLAFSWGSVAGADFYNLYRGSMDALATGGYDHTCLQGHLTGPGVVQPDAAGSAYFLVTAQNHAGEGPAGRDGSGQAIPIAPADRCAP